jgi:hypothetical protein
MAYSGLVQAFPVLGGIFKINRILSKVGRAATRKMKRGASLTDILRWAISADLIDRFVIRTTLDDMRMLADSMNYVIRTVETARNRNVMPASFHPRVVNSTIRSETEGSITLGNQRFEYKATDFGLASRALHVLADVNYDIDPSTPLRLWLNRCGLTRPLESLWDLIPFSFVVDYFVRVQDFVTEVSDLTTDVLGLKGKVTQIRGMWGCETREHGISMKCTAVNQPPLSSKYYYLDYDASQGSCERSVGEFHRFPIPGDLAQRGFWDRGGVFASSMSSTRKRTLWELFIQARLK